jgi:hypothetical protein
MKKIISLFVLFSGLLISCKGDQGEPGINSIGNVFEIEADFNAVNGYSTLFEFPSSVEVFESDVVLVYILTEVNGGVSVWELLPDSVFLNDGSILQYDFDHTFLDVVIFLNGDTDFDALDDAWTQNQVFRIAVLPADFAQNNNIDITNIDEVTGALSIENIERIQLNN